LDWFVQLQLAKLNSILLIVPSPQVLLDLVIAQLLNGSSKTTYKLLARRKKAFDMSF
jgi:hypothetical protein